MIKYRIRTLYTTAAELTADNPLLLEGEMGTESDTLKQKIGDGVTAWVDLPYITSEQKIYACLIDSTDPAMIYVGRAAEGSDEGDAVWTIRRSTFDAAGALLTTGSAVAVTWTGRTGHTYS